ncbi:MAG TPA: hypothetical protein VM933_08370 [Acidimicrobiales bacterium]|nr:hypothetical protein [Acidimicrobiales bacterium]
MASDDVAAFKDRLARVAERLYAVDTEPQFTVLRAGGTLRGRSAELAATVTPTIDGLWGRYLALKERADARSDGAPVDGADVDALVTLEADLEAVDAVASQLSEAWRRLLPWVDQASTALADAMAAAARLRLDPDEPVLSLARRELADLQDDVAADPLAADGRAAHDAVTRAGAWVQERAASRQALPDALAHAEQTVARLRSLVAEGREALEAARVRVLDHAGLLEPLAPTVADGDARSLGPWLDRLRNEAVEGDAEAAAAGVARWQVVADGAVRNAEAVVSANRAPIERRDRLRGLLDAYEAKAGAARLAEVPEIAELVRAARAALLARPADVDAGEAAVTALGAALTSAARPATRP